MPDYSKAIVYAIVSECKCYIGSTTQTIKKRINHHKRSAEGKTTGRSSCSSKELILKPDMSYSIIELFPCKTKAELLDRERYWIKNYSVQNPEYVVINQKVNLNQSSEERLQLKREWGHKFYTENKEVIKARVRKYREDNKEAIIQRKRKYREDNKGAIIQRMLQKVKCDVCNKEISKCHLNRHKKSSNCI